MTDRVEEKRKDTTPPVDVEAWWAATAKVTQERDAALTEATDCKSLAVAVIERLTTERDGLLAEVVLLRDLLDGTVETPTRPAPELEREADALGPFTGAVASDAREWVAHQNQLNGS